MTSSASDASSPWWYLLLALALIVIWVRYAIKMRNRKRQMSAMATRVGLEAWPANSVPRGLSLNKTPFANCNQLFNVYEGMVAGQQIAVFDLRRKVGKASSLRTIIAAKTFENVFEGTAFGLERRQVGEWQMIFEPTKIIASSALMDVTEIEEIIRDIVRNSTQQPSK